MSIGETNDLTGARGDSGSQSPIDCVWDVPRNIEHRLSYGRAESDFIAGNIGNAHGQQQYDTVASRDTGGKAMITLLSIPEAKPSQISFRSSCSNRSPSLTRAGSLAGSAPTSHQKFFLVRLY